MNFEPVCYDHAANLIGKTPWAVSRDSALLGQAHQAVIDTYGYQTCVVGIDIYNVEIEAMGCEIPQPAGNGVPSAGAPAFDEIDELLALSFDPERSGRIPLIFDAAQHLAEANPACDIRIPLSGPFTIACHLIGMENMICELFEDPEPATVALQHLAHNQQRFARAAVQRGFHISLFESSVTPPLLSPTLFADHVAPTLAPILAESSHSQLIIGGDTLPILDTLCALHPDSIICPVETDQAAFVQHRSTSPLPAIRVNMRPAVFLAGNLDAAIVEARRAAALAEHAAVGSVGSLIPFDADPTIIQAVANALSH